MHILLFNIFVCIWLVSHLENKERKSFNTWGKQTQSEIWVLVDRQSGGNSSWGRFFLFPTVFIVCMYMFVCVCVLSVPWLGFHVMSPLGVFTWEAATLIPTDQWGQRCLLNFQKVYEAKPALMSRDRSSAVVRAWGWALEAGRPPRLLGSSALESSSMGQLWGNRAFVKCSFDEKHNINTNLY